MRLRASRSYNALPATCRGSNPPLVNSGSAAEGGVGVLGIPAVEVDSAVRDAFSAQAECHRAVPMVRPRPMGASEDLSGAPLPILAFVQRTRRARPDLELTSSTSSPERIRTAVAGSKGQHAWPLHHGARLAPTGQQGYEDSGEEDRLPGDGSCRSAL